MRAVSLVWLGVGLARVCAQEPTGDDLYLKGRELERKGDVVRAYLLYSQAAGQNPKDRQAWMRAQALRRRATAEAKVFPTASEELAKEKFVPEYVPEVEWRETKKALPPRELQIPEAAKSKRDFNLQGDSRQLWESVAKAYGFDVVFDGDYQPVAKLTLRLADVTFEEAMEALRLATASFSVAVSEKMALVARDSQQKRQELEHNIAVAIPLPDPVTVQEAQELARSVQQVMELQKFTVDSRRRMAVIRGQQAKVEAAQFLFSQLLSRRPEVMMEVEFIEVNESTETKFGLQLQTDFPLVWLSNILNSKPSFPSGFTQFITFGGGYTHFGLGIAAAQAFANYTESKGNVLLRTEIRSSSGQAANFHVGERYPVLTAGYFGNTPQNPDIPVYTPPPTFNFEDLGIVLKLTPQVHDQDDISMAVEAEFKVLTGEAANGIPVIASRKIVTSCRLRNGEWAVVAGLVKASEARVITGLAGVSTLPALGPLFRQNTKTRNSGQAILAIRPRLLSVPPSELVTKAMWTGTESRPRSGLVN